MCLCLWPLSNNAYRAMIKTVTIPSLSYSFSNHHLDISIFFKRLKLFWFGIRPFPQVKKKMCVLTRQFCFGISIYLEWFGAMVAVNCVYLYKRLSPSHWKCIWKKSGAKKEQSYAAIWGQRAHQHSASETK